MNASLKRMMLGAVALLLVAGVSLSTVIELAGHMEAARERITADARRIATVGAPLVLGALVVDDLATAEQALGAMNADQAYATLRLLSPSEALVLDLSPGNPRPSVAPSWFRALLAVELPEIRAPVQGGGVLYGTISVKPASRTVEDNAWTRVRGAALETGALLMLLILAIERALAWGFRPLHQLAEAATRFGRGDLTARMPPTRIAEVFHTAQAFNAMADRLQRLLGELRAKDVANRRLAAAVEQSDEAIITIDTERHVTTWNGGAEALFGYRAATAVGRPLEMLFAELPEAERDDAIARLIAAVPAAPFEALLPRRAGEPVEIAASATALVGDASESAGWVVVLRDVTARKRFEHSLAEAKRQAELANRSKSEFLANMSHELRTPLNAVIGFSGLMQAETFGPLGAAKYREYLADIQNSGQHLLQLINDLLDVSAIEADKVELQEAEIDLHVLAEAAIRLVHPRAVAGRVSLAWRVADGAPLVRADARRLKQMLLNLLSNAIKFTPPNGRASLLIRGAADGSVEFVVEDNGIGMDAAGIDTALKRFGQVDAGLSRRHEGTGLGLPLTKALAELHGGTLRLESTPGAGTRATIVLPPARALAPRSTAA